MKFAKTSYSAAAQTERNLHEKHISLGGRKEEGSNRCDMMKNGVNILNV